ncbi:MAG TPA: hypothetical protein PKA82_01345 [Pyrinomonadaceae bacterium]|mgnify:CR=1 FL=1|nr:hypothetical protein [Pyrinomonadaceae bacterium]
MNEEDLPDLIRWKRGFERGAERLEEIRRKEIRESDISKCYFKWDGFFEHAKEQKFPRKTYLLSKAMRVFLGVDRKDDSTV